MTKLIAGFLLGVISTLAAVYWFDEISPEPQPSLASQSSPSRTAADERGANPMARIDNVAKTDTNDAQPPVYAESIADDESLEAPVQVTASPQQDAQPSPRQRPSARPYPPEIADMLEYSVDKELQARYESDAREDSWASYMEGQLSAYFAQKPALAQFNFSMTDCRTSICEIHALGYGVDALTQWNSATADMVSQPWFEFNSMSMNRHNPEPDILGIVLILTKKPPN